MKVNIEIDCLPAEARAFLGLPDVTALNEHLTSEMVRRMDANMESLEPDALMRQWSAYGGQMTDTFMNLMRQAAVTPTPGTKK
ncbi:DUF6489 family protein [uncultured Maricaulis sp.]|uniref:DUF6489 family protein n=1 Tax=uncultured Maricaulis sp. TaxID=174710 RepID=UPI0030DC9461|tara:strand:- start:43488 stop:43736 length:249 start_codon:yes stop_codon:yes gene_type:complete